MNREENDFFSLLKNVFGIADLGELRLIFLAI